MTQITETACKIMTHKKEKHSRAEARVETAVVVGETPRGTSPAYPIAGYVVTKTCWSVQVKEGLSGWSTPGVTFQSPSFCSYVSWDEALSPLWGRKSE